MKKFFALTIAMLMVLTAFAACGDTSSSTPAPVDSSAAPVVSSEAPATEDLTFGWSVYEMANSFFERMDEGVQAKATELGVTLISHDQQNDETEMVSGCTRLINDDKVDALVISPCKPEAMTTIVELAKAADIPVVICDIGDGGSDKDVIIVSDMYGGGEMAGKYCLQLLEENGVEGKDYAVIRCEESATYAARRPEGFKDIMDAAGYNMVQELTADSDKTKGRNSMEDILTSNSSVVAVFAANDNMALGAMEACIDKGRDDILIFGFDGNDEAITAIKEGTLAGTVGQDASGIGSLGVQCAFDLCGGKTLEYDDPATKEIFAPVTMIGKDGEEVAV